MEKEIMRENQVAIKYIDFVTSNPELLPCRSNRDFNLLSTP